MRNLFLLLLLANLGLLGWQQWIGPAAPDDVPVSIEQNELPRLMLTKEVTPEPDVGAKAVEIAEVAGGSEGAEPAEAEGVTEEVAEAAVVSDESADEPPAGTPPAPIEEAPATAAAAPREAAGHCVSIGPFRDLTETTQAMTSLRDAGREPRQRLAEGEVWIGHWVYLPAFESRSAARTVLNRLKEHGIVDSYIVPSGEERNAVSLGVFAERDRARRRVAEISALGYAPRVSDRHRSGAVYWVDTELEPAATLQPGDIETVPGRIMRLDVIDCPSNELQMLAGESG